MFVNRTNELKTLNSEFTTSNSSFTVIYGRRRVGKTTLIKEYIKNKEMIYYYATEVNLAMQLKSFTKDVLEI
jgi:AAA+ ATPase superfamily predicted ATPase